MAIDFYSALHQLVKAHAREVQDLQKRIAVHRDSAECIDTVAYKDELDQKLSSRSKQSSYRESHCSPVDIPTMLPSIPHWTKHWIVTPRTPSTPLASHPTHSTQKDLAIQVKPDRKEMQGKSDSVSLHASEDIVDCTSNGSAVDSMPERITEQWRLFTYHLLLHSRSALYTIHPGWIDEKSKSRRESTICVSRSVVARGSASVGATLTAQMHKALKADKDSKGMGFSRSGTMLYWKATSLFGFPRHVNRNSLVVHPDSSFRRLWILLCLIVFMYEAIALTMAPFRLTEVEHGKLLEWLSAFFWLCDIGLNFISGVYIDGTLELRLRVVAWCYAKTWFTFDLIVVALQFIGVLVGSVNEHMSATLVLRIIRIVRSLRLGRIIYWLRHEVGFSRVAMSRGKLIQVMIAMYFFSHCSACLLYAVGKYEGGWISKYSDRLKDDSLSPSVAHNYLVCLHWALSQFQGNIDMYPGTGTIGNKLFVVITSFCSIVALTLFVSNATDIFSDVRHQRQYQIEEQRLLDEFFGRHVIDPEIRQRANYFLHVKKKQQKVLESHERDQLALKKFPAKLRSLLVAEMWSSLIVWHPVFAYLSKHKKHFFAKVCATALSVQTYEPRDDVFIDGDLSKRAHIISNGEFVMSTSIDIMFKNLRSQASGWSGKASVSTTKSAQVRPSTGSISSRLENTSSSWPEQGPERMSSASSDVQLVAFLDEGKAIRKVYHGQIVSEISLWMPWMHIGDLSALHHGQCLEISTVDLIATLKPYASIFSFFSLYAARFVLAAKQMRENQQDKFIELMGFRQVIEMETQGGNTMGAQV